MFEGLGFEGEVLMIEIGCPFCGRVHYVAVDEDDFVSWQTGELVQKAFPYLNATERESLISGMCPDCQAEMFGN